MAARTVSVQDVESEVKVKKKSSRKIAAPPWLRNRLMGVKSTTMPKAGPVPCCGVNVAGDVSVILEERQYEDKSVQCDDLLPDNEHRYGFHRNRYGWVMGDRLHKSKQSALIMQWKSMMHIFLNSDRCAGCCHPTNPIYQTNVIVNQIPYMDDEPDDVSLPTFRRSHHPIRHRRNSRFDTAPSEALFRKNNLFATPALHTGASAESPFRHSSYIVSHNDPQDCNSSLSQSEVSIPNTIEYGPAEFEPAKPKVPLRRRTGAYGNVTLNVQIANGINSAILEEGERVQPVVPRRKRGIVAPDRKSCQETASQSSCLVLGINSDARNPLNYKMYTPFYNKRQTMPPEHFKNWPSESRYGDESDEQSFRTLSYYSEEANQLEQYERRSFDAGSSSMLNAIDSNSIMHRSSMDNLPKVCEQSELESNHWQARMRRNGTIEAIPIVGVGKTPVNVGRYSRQIRQGAELRAKNKPSDQIPAQPQSNLLTPPTSTFGRWSGSIQNLFSIGNRTSDGTGRWSKSENCLNEVGKRSRLRNGTAKPADSRLPWSDRLFGRTTVAGRTGKNGRARRTNTFLTSGGGSFFTYKYDDEEESAWQKYFSLGMLRKIRSKQGKPSKGKDDRLVQLN
uniref:Uncharacterized protein n=1 Tax=Anopheles christyi TaxID=43041 RepID=A0A182JNS3_9DIPT